MLNCIEMRLYRSYLLLFILLIKWVGFHPFTISECQKLWLVLFHQVWPKCTRVSSARAGPWGQPPTPSPNSQRFILELPQEPAVREKSLLIWASSKPTSLYGPPRSHPQCHFTKYYPSARSTDCQKMSMCKLSTIQLSGWWRVPQIIFCDGAHDIINIKEKLGPRVSGNNLYSTLNFCELICAGDIYQYEHEHTKILGPKV